MDVQEAQVAVAKVGRPSHYPVTVRYSESTDIHAVIAEAANRNGLSLSEMQRIVNRAGIQALNLCPVA